MTTTDGPYRLGFPLPDKPMLDLMESIPLVRTPGHKDAMLQALHRGEELRARLGLTAQDVGAIATLWAATAAIGFSKYGDGSDLPAHVVESLETQRLGVQSVVLASLQGDEGLTQRAMTYASLADVLLTAPFTAQRPAATEAKRDG